MGRRRPPCGERGGYYAHRRRGERACLACCDASSKYMRERRAGLAGTAIARQAADGPPGPVLGDCGDAYGTPPLARTVHTVTAVGSYL